MTTCTHECFCHDSRQSDVFLFVCIHICSLGVSKRGKTNVFLYICIRYIYIQTTVHNVHSTVLCSVHTVTKRKKGGRLYIV